MDENIMLIKKNPLTNKIHERAKGFRVNKDAIELLQDQIEFITEILIDLIVSEVKKDSRKTIMLKDVENSFDEFMSNKLEINEILDILETSVEKLRILKDNNHVSKYFEV